MIIQLFERLFIELHDAYETLVDDDKRKEYDALRSASIPVRGDDDGDDDERHENKAVSNSEHLGAAAEIE